MTSPEVASRSHSLDTPNSVELPYTSDQPDSQTSTWQHTTILFALAEFEPTIAASERPQTHALDLAGSATEISMNKK